MKYELLQLKNAFLRDYGFRSYDESRMPARSCYAIEANGDVGDNAGDLTCLDRLFARYNIGLPPGYRGRSVSVSDVVIFHGDRAYYCDTMGWKLLPSAWAAVAA